MKEQTTIGGQMIFHRVEKVAKGKKFVYDVNLIQRKYMFEKNLGNILNGIKKESTAHELAKVLEEGFRNGVKAAEHKIGREIKL